MQCSATRTVTKVQHKQVFHKYLIKTFDVVTVEKVFHTGGNSHFQYIMIQSQAAGHYYSRHNNEQMLQIDNIFHLRMETFFYSAGVKLVEI